DFVNSRRIDEDHLRLAEAGQCVAGSVPGHMPNLAGPTAADIDAGDVTNDKGVDEGAFTCGNLAEDDDLDPPADELIVHLLEPRELGPQRGFFVASALADAVKGLLDGGDGLLVGVGGGCGIRQDGARFGGEAAK